MLMGECVLKSHYISDTIGSEVDQVLNYTYLNEDINTHYPNKVC